MIKKLKCLYIHLDKEYDIDDAIKEFRQYYEDIKVTEFIKEFNDNFKDKKIKLDNIFNLLTDFNEFYKNQKVNKRKLFINFKDYYNKKKLKMFIDENNYDDLLIKFDELDYIKLKMSYQKKLNLMKNITEKYI